MTAHPSTGPDAPIPVDALPRIEIVPNWPIAKLDGRRYLVRTAGNRLEAIGQQVVNQVRDQRVDGVDAGLIHDLDQSPGEVRGFRFVMTDRRWHRAVADLTLRRQGQDLFVQLRPAARSALAPLRKVVLACVFVTLWCAIYAAYLSGTDAYRSLVQEYAGKHHRDSVSLATAALMTGQRWDREREAWSATGNGPVGFVELASMDPKLFLFNMGGVPSILAAGIGSALFYARRRLVYVPARFLEWPTPDDFEAMTNAHHAWIDGMVSHVLMSRFGIGQAQITAQP